MSDNVPITEDLRDAMKRYDNFDGTSRVVLGESNFDRLCDAIDATHANLERENAKLREHLNELLMIGSFNGSCRRDCRYMDDCLADRFGQPDCFVCQELQELGIEVPR